MANSWRSWCSSEAASQWEKSRWLAAKLVSHNHLGNSFCYKPMGCLLHVPGMTWTHLSLLTVPCNPIPSSLNAPSHFELATTYIISWTRSGGFSLLATTRTAENADQTQLPTQDIFKEMAVMQLHDFRSTNFCPWWQRNWRSRRSTMWHRGID